MTGTASYQPEIIITVDDDNIYGPERRTPAAAPKVSVILPLYNCEKFLPKLFAELEAQSLSDYEVICVDDGSTDGTAGAVLLQCGRDKRYTSVTVPHGGAGAARNAGLDRAAGEYVIWLDADDDYQPDLLEELVSGADSVSADIAMCLYEEIDHDAGRKKDGTAFRTDAFPPGAVIDPSSANLSYHDFGIRITNKLYRRQFVVREGLRFSGTIIANDVFFNYASVSVARRVTGIHECLMTVHRYLNPDSISSKRGEHLEDALAAYRELWAFLEERKLDGIYKDRYCSRVITDALYNLQYPYNHRFVTGLAEFYCTERPWTSYSGKDAAEKFWKYHDTGALTERIMKLEKDIISGTGNLSAAWAMIRSLSNRRQALNAMERTAEEKYGKTIIRKKENRGPGTGGENVPAGSSSAPHGFQ